MRADRSNPSPIATFNGNSSGDGSALLSCGGSPFNGLVTVKFLLALGTLLTSFTGSITSMNIGAHSAALPTTLSGFFFRKFVVHIYITDVL